MKNIGTHTVDGVAPGEDFGRLDEATARRRAKQGAVSWDDYRAAFLVGHVCEVCDRSFDSARGLATHQRSHEGSGS